MPKLCIKHNNCAVNAPCPVCGTRTEPIVGPDAFVEGTWEVVCEECQREHAPELKMMLDLFRSAYPAFDAQDCVHGPAIAVGAPEADADVIGPLCRAFERELRELDAPLLQSAVQRPEVTPDDEVNYFGGCPICHGDDGHLNVERTHWGICRRHWLRWCIGGTLFSAWKDESEWTHRRNEIYLVAFKQAEVYHAPQPDNCETPVRTCEAVPF